MDLCSKKAIKFWLKKYGLQPLKGLGQNFLIDKSVLKKIVWVADLKLEDVVLEIGPGIGTLTQELGRAISAARPALRSGRVIAVEKDAKMVEILKETLKDYKNIEIIHDDILKTNIQYLISLPRRQAGNIQYKLVANLPYNVATAVIRKFLEAKNPPTEMILTIQKEVAQRITAKPPRMNLLAVSVQFYAEPKIINYISKRSFWPIPKVDSAIIKIKSNSPEANLPEARPRATARGRASGASSAENLFFKIVKAGFSQPRKQLINNLSSLAAPELTSPNEASGRQEGQKGQEGQEGKKRKEEEKEKIRAWLLKNSIQPSQRAETLTINDWINLAKSF